MRRRLALAALASSATAGCVSVKLGSEPAAPVQLSLRDAAAAPPVLRVPLAVALTPALLIQAQPGQALADTLAIAYTRREGEYAFYQLASWTEIPVRQVPRLLQRRLQQRHIADAVGLLGDPMGADWLLSVGVDSLHHDSAARSSTARPACSRWAGRSSTPCWPAPRARRPKANNTATAKTNSCLGKSAR